MHKTLYNISRGRQMPSKHLFIISKGASFVEGGGSACAMLMIEPETTLKHLKVVSVYYFSFISVNVRASKQRTNKSSHLVE